ncbi:MAG TPA: CDP-alcohol phosphatidyltransferase family protein [Acidimicrobiales bacterium]|nr:CDP-alcohol phosphatidyltransferase family protein [Acidimicrobiales bacterium]
MPDGEDRIVTVPNILSVVRLACVPLFLWLLFGRDDRWAAALLLAALGATDWVDGWVARRFGQVSRLGKVLDPTADRILLLVGIGAILVDGSVPAWVAVAALSREAVVAIAALVLAALGATRIDVQWVGKAGTFALMVAFPLFLASEADIGWAGTARVLAWLVAVPGLALSWYAVTAYVPLARRALREGRVGSQP